MINFKGFFKSNAALRREISALRELNKDLDAQVRESLTRVAITPQEESEIARLRQEHDRLVKEQAEIVVFLRNNFPKEILRGDHLGMSLAQVVCMYMGQARILKDPVQ
jgi:hypothetical protein